jgi:hypothetical protein
MNELLQLKGELFQRKSPSRPGAPKLPNGSSVNCSKLSKLQSDLVRLHEFWKNEKLISGALVSVQYTRVIPKSKRIQGYLSKGSQNPNDSIVGAQFTSGDNRKHIITHFVQLPLLLESIKRVTSAIRILEDHFSCTISSFDLDHLEDKAINFNDYDTCKSHFRCIIVDSQFVEEFTILEGSVDTDKTSIVTIYQTNEDSRQLLEKIGIKVLPGKIVDKTTILLSKDEISLLASKAPYLISMATEDISKMTKEDFQECEDPRIMTIPAPQNEPVVGVIDTLFDDTVYFSSWVDYHNMLDKDIPISSEDYIHGTSISSIIVDGPAIEPELDDGCGRFRVRHFGVAKSGYFSSFSIMKSIEEIVMSNKDIKVWNLSLGSTEEVNENFISLEASILDRIQYENDVIFVVAGTNRPNSIDHDMRIGAPADSINSIIVNSVDFNNQPAIYSRRGIILSFFNKPDVSFYGGTPERRLRVCGPLGQRYVMGTSIAAPWITRKVAYLIEVLGFSREVAKALLIDSSAGWSEKPDFDQASLIGHGVVHKHIDGIVKSSNDEIKFVIAGESEKYDTYNYNIPVPLHKNEYPFIARATLCYFPKCSRNQGVDYTNTELDVHLGRIDDNGKIKSIDNNNQSVPYENHYLRETNARRLFRKWDNAKHIREAFNPRGRAKISYENKMWGVSIKTKERLNARDGDGIRFGLVVTLKEINGVNRIDDFIRQCSLRGWLVNRVSIETQVDIYNKAEEEITFE